MVKDGGVACWGKNASIQNLEYVAIPINIRRNGSQLCIIVMVCLLNTIFSGFGK